MTAAIVVALPVYFCCSFAQTPAGAPSGAPTLGRHELEAVPRIGLRAMPGYGRVPLTVGFAVLALGIKQPDFTAYHWNFGDGTVSSSPPAMTSHTYRKPGTYIVTFTGVARDGQLVTALASVIAVGTEPLR